MPKNVLLICTLMINCVFSTSCIRRIINKNWPPMSSCDRQLEAVRASNAKLAALPRTDVYASVSSKDINTYLAPVMAAAIPGISNLSVRTDLQQVILTFDFDLNFNTSELGNVRLAG